MPLLRPQQYLAIPNAFWSRCRSWLPIGVLVAVAAAVSASEPTVSRQVISLDGPWQVEEGTMDAVPKEYTHTVVVPGLVDMANPAFLEPGPRVKDRQARSQKDPRRDAYWYRRTFELKEPLPAVAMLKVRKAMFGTRVFVNGQLVGDHWGSYTPGLFDVRGVLKPGENELVVRVGADRNALPSHVPSGMDSEKLRNIPGIYDSVELILSGTPHIVNVQTAPDITAKEVWVQTLVHNAGPDVKPKLTFTIREVKSGKVVGQGHGETDSLIAGGEWTADVRIPIAECRLWSPEDPFLYELVVDTGADQVRTRFGMREFHFDPKTGSAMLNGKPYFMRGSNICIFRFMEDGARKDLPWREEWVRRLHRSFKDFQWNCLRYCIGFPPEIWYDIADEEGILIQDEFPVWGVKNTGWVDELTAEYTEWMRERWNHPCVVIWDAQNETPSTETGTAIKRIRMLDLSNRPWDNGEGPPVDPGDSCETHAYHYMTTVRLQDLAKATGSVTRQEVGYLGRAANGTKNVIVNEYGWLWLDRDGAPTELTVELYKNLLGPDATTAQRRRLYARLLAADTEFWRCHRNCAAVMHFCSLGYSQPNGATSDHWADVEKLQWDPDFLKYVRDSFNPVGLMIDAWAENYPPGSREFPVVVINDLYESWKGTVRFRLLRDGQTVVEKSQPCEIAPLGRERLTFAIDIPAQPADYEVEAALIYPDAKVIRSVREFHSP